MKKHPEHKIDELLDRSLHNLQGETSAQDWEEIRQRLQREQKSERWFTFFIGRRALGIAMLLLFVFSGIGYYSFQESTINDQPIAMKENDAKAQQEIGSKNMTKNGKQNFSESANASKVSNNPTENYISISKNNFNTRKNKAEANTETDDKKASKERKFYNEEKKNRKQENSLVVEDKNTGVTNPENQPVQTNKFAENIELKIAEDALIEDSTAIKQETKSLAENINSLAQDPVKQKVCSAGKKFSFGISFSPMFGGQSTSFNTAKTEQTHKRYFELRSASEKPATGYKAGIFAQYNIWKGLNVQTGIQYQQRREKATYNFYNSEIPVIDSASGNILGYIKTEDSASINYNHHNIYSYTVVPLQIGYEFSLSEKWRIGLQAGGNAMFLSDVKGKTLRPDDLTLTEINNLRKTNFSLTVLPAIYYRFQKCFSIGLEANYSQLLNPVQNQNSTIQTKPWNIGAGVNLRFSPF